MADQPPILVNPIPPQVINEGAAFGPFDLENYIQLPEDDIGMINFKAELANGMALPTGLMCTRDGKLHGIPPNGTQGHYDILITATTEAGEILTTHMDITIKPRPTTEDPMFLTDLKSRVWEALGKNLPLPEMSALLNRPISPVEVYYLLQRWATLTIWDAHNFDFPDEKRLIHLPNESPHYNIYDRGTYLVGAPKDLFSHQRTLEDALQTARVMAREVYKRNWTIEFGGFNKMVRAAWVELQLLGEAQNKTLQILHYTPSTEDLRLYATRSRNQGPKVG